MTSIYMPSPEFSGPFQIPGRGSPRFFPSHSQEVSGFSPPFSPPPCIIATTKLFALPTIFVPYPPQRNPPVFTSETLGIRQQQWHVFWDLGCASGTLVLLIATLSACLRSPCSLFALVLILPLLSLRCRTRRIFGQSPSLSFLQPPFTSLFRRIP